MAYIPSLVCFSIAITIALAGHSIALVLRAIMIVTGWLPVHSRENQRGSEARAADRRNAQRRGLAGERVESAPQIRKNPIGHPCAHATRRR